MHFHWDNFDVVFYRVIRGLLPPILNLFFILFLFYQGLTSVVNFAWGVIRKLTVKASEEVGGSQSVMGDLESLFAPILMRIERFMTDLDLDSGVDLLFRSLREAWNVSVSGFVGFLIAIIFLAVFVDLVVRAIGAVLPFRAEINERNLVRHPSLRRNFAEIGIDPAKLNVKPTYLIWLHAKLQAEAYGEKGSYIAVRNRILARMVENERFFSYVTPYILFSIVTLLFFSTPKGAITLLIALGAAAYILYRHFCMGRDLVSHDLETYAVIPVGAAGKAKFDQILKLELDAVTAKNPSDLRNSDTCGDPRWFNCLDVVPSWIVNIFFCFGSRIKMASLFILCRVGLRSNEGASDCN